jgi:hypothetical protein
MKYKLRIMIIELIALSLCLAGFSMPINAEENYQIVMTLESPEPQEEANFGYPVYITENRIITAEVEVRVDSLDVAGKAYIFDLDGNHIASLQAPLPHGEGFFGMAILGNKDVVLIGEHGAQVDDVLEAGLVHVYDKDGNYIKSISSPEPAFDTHFGASLAFIDDYIVSVDDAEVDGHWKAGRVYIMDLDGELHNTLESPDPQDRSLFGYPLTTGYNKIVASEQWATVEDKSGAGRVHVFDSSGAFLKTLHSPEPSNYASFGCSVVLYDDIIVISEGEPEEGEIRSVYVFDIEGNYMMTLESPETVEEVYFGISIAVNEDYIFVGEDEGRVYVYDRKGALLATLDGFEGVNFVGVSGELIVVADNSDVMDTSEAGKVFFLEIEIASFELSSLSINPSSIKEGDSVTISCEVTNIGTSSGSYTVTLKIDGEVKEEKEVSLDAGSSEKVSFELACESAGEFNVDVNGETGSYEVTKAQTGIPGFPLGSILTGLAATAILLWATQRKQ